MLCLQGFKSLTPSDPKLFWMVAKIKGILQLMQFTNMTNERSLRELPLLGHHVCKVGVIHTHTNTHAYT